MITKTSLLIGWSLTHILWPSELAFSWVMWQKIRQPFSL